MSQLLEEGLYALISGDPGIAAIAGDGTTARVYPLRLPTKAQTPALTYFGLGGPREQVHSGDAGLPHPRFQINCIADDYLTAKTLAAAVVKKLSGYRGPCGTSGTIACEAQLVPDAFDDVGRHDFVPVDVTIWHQEGH